MYRRIKARRRAAALLRELSYTTQAHPRLDLLEQLAEHMFEVMECMSSPNQLKDLYNHGFPNRAQADLFPKPTGQPTPLPHHP